MCTVDQGILLHICLSNRGCTIHAFFVESCVNSFAYIVIGNSCASMKGALQHIIVESGIQFVEGIKITMLR